MNRTGFGFFVPDFSCILHVQVDFAIKFVLKRTFSTTHLPRIHSDKCPMIAHHENLRKTADSCTLSEHYRNITPFQVSCGLVSMLKAHCSLMLTVADHNCCSLLNVQFEKTTCPTSVLIYYQYFCGKYMFGFKTGKVK